MEPETGRKRPSIKSTSEVLPAPLPPAIPINPPTGIFNEIESIALIDVPGYEKLTFINSIFWFILNLSSL